ncbi:hypothetical protein DEU35_1460 [Microbacterium sp. AG157]|uniref:hypothetical protein n=1 Tax=Microbacterium sp. AG157 TaxID=2183993 RepID=UPI000E24C2E3|nr:hypothetical protein [Microbacterium sp. AG157]REC98360.1 hypothetical protein DEU35_1460 [Microbacterium sp. AG157]
MTGPAEFKPEMVQDIWERDGGRCALCGLGLHWDLRGKPFERGWSVHHREDRGMGGVKRARKGREQPRAYLALAANGVLLCGTGTTGCHGKVTREELPERLGFSVSRIGIRRPVDVPLLHALHGWVLLDNEGGYAPADEPDEEEMAA